MRPLRTRSSRARLALVACALWLAGVEVLPAIHEALHDRLAPHTHVGGSIVTVSFGEPTHLHADGSIHYAAAPSGMRTRTSRDGRPRAADASHRADGLAHHAAAIAPVPPPVTRPLPIDRRPSFVIIARTLEPVARDPLAATARGPPRTV